MRLSNVLKISHAASLALHAMTLLAAHPHTGISTRRIASELHVSEAHLSKVLQRLARVGLAVSTRGPNGGFSLGRNADKITLLDVYETIEGPLVPNTCLLGAPICEGKRCILGDLLETVHKRVSEYLASTRLSELTSIYRSETRLAEKEDADT